MCSFETWQAPKENSRDTHEWSLGGSFVKYTTNPDFTFMCLFIFLYRRDFEGFIPTGQEWDYGKREKITVEIERTLLLGALQGPPGRGKGLLFHREEWTRLEGARCGEWDERVAWLDVAQTMFYPMPASPRLSRRGCNMSSGWGWVRAQGLQRKEEV